MQSKQKYGKAEKNAKTRKKKLKGNLSRPILGGF